MKDTAKGIKTTAVKTGEASRQVGPSRTFAMQASEVLTREVKLARFSFKEHSTLELGYSVEFAEPAACDEALMKTLKDDDGLRDKQVGSAIHHLDPERSAQNGDRPILVLVITLVVIWIIFLAVLYSLAI